MNVKIGRRPKAAVWALVLVTSVLAVGVSNPADPGPPDARIPYSAGAVVATEPSPPPPPGKVPDRPPEPLEITAPVLPVPPPTTPPAPPPAPPAPGDRWLLMKILQGTWPGAALDSERMLLSGWIEGSYTFSSDRRTNLPMGFNYVANDFLLQQNWLRIERTVVTTGTTEPTFGFRNDWILPGSDYLFLIQRGIFNGQLTASHGRPNRLGIDPIQFYAEGYWPTVAQGLDVKFGRIFCQFGVEANDAVSNALLSHSYTYVYDPFTQTGLIATCKLTRDWTAQAGMLLGSDIFIDPADTPTGMASIKWAPPDGRDSVLFSCIVGPGRFNVERHFHNPEVFDFVYVHKINPRLTWSLDGLYGFTTNVPETGFANWFGIVNYLTCDFTPRVSGTTRLEFFDDCQGQRTGFPGLYTVLTAGLNLKLRKDLVLRPELRFDYNGESRPFENKHGLFTVASDIILRW
jgi:hypothetical protein